ncbi:MAG: hypothetical protein AAFX40_00735 [Cyanobacteria bacterium J06639_1]
MPVPSPQIDLRQVYPCPCCRQSGQLRSIILTDAMGCDRCQQIFQLNPEGDAIEQMAGTYPYRRTWYWQGQRWVSERDRAQLGKVASAIRVAGFAGMVLLTVGWMAALGIAFLSKNVGLALVLLIFLTPPLFHSWGLFVRWGDRSN